MTTNPIQALNERQHRFCTEYVFGKHYGNASRCYAIAYDRPDPTDAVCRVNACRLLKRTYIQKALESLRAEFREQERLTPEQHLAHLQSIRDDAREAQQFSAAVRAEELRGKVMGFYVNRHLHEAEPLTREAMVHRLNRLMDESPRLRSLIAAHGPAEANIG